MLTEPEHCVQPVQGSGGGGGWDEAGWVETGVECATFWEGGQPTTLTKQLANDSQHHSTESRTSIPQVIKDAVIEQDGVLRHHCHGGSQ